MSFDYIGMYKRNILECEYILSQLELMEKHAPKDTGLEEEIKKHSGVAEITYYLAGRKNMPVFYDSYEFNGGSHIKCKNMSLPLSGDLTIETTDGFKYEGPRESITLAENILQTAKLFGTERIKQLVLREKEDYEKSLANHQAQPGNE